MKRNQLPLLAVLAACVVWAGCLIDEVDQPESVRQGEVATLNIVVHDEQSDENAWEGVVGVMVPLDWEFVSGTYGGDVGTGEMELLEEWADSLAKIRPPDEGMKWIATISDDAYSHGEDVYHEVELNFQVGVLIGSFDLGYFVFKNAYANTQEIEELWDWGAADTSMGHTIMIELGTSIEDQLREGIPAQIYLEQNYPNPFNPGTTIRYALQDPAEVRLAVYDLRGREIAVLDEGARSAGMHTVQFDAGFLATGMYLYKLHANGHTVTRSMILNK